MWSPQDSEMWWLDRLLSKLKVICSACGCFKFDWPCHLPGHTLKSWPFKVVRSFYIMASNKREKDCLFLSYWWRRLRGRCTRCGGYKGRLKNGAHLNYSLIPKRTFKND